MEGIAAPRRYLGVPMAWWIAGGSCFGICFGFSSFFGAIFGQLIIPISTEYGWTRAQTTGAVTLTTLLTIALAPIGGYFVDKGKVTAALLFTAILLPIAVGSIAIVNGNLVQYYLTFALIAVAGVGGLPASYSAVILKWFDQRRGLGMGFPVAGVGIAIIALPPTIRYLISLYGWQIAVTAVACTMFIVVVPIVAFLLPKAPVGRSEIDAELPPPKSCWPPETDAGGMEFKAALKTRAFLQLAVAFILLMVTSYGVMINLQAMLQDIGLPASTAAQLLSVEGFFILVFRIFSGWLLDRFPPRVTASLIFIAPAIGLLLMLMSHSIPVLILAIGLLGLGFGGEFDVISFFTSRYFGRRAFGRLYGIYYSCGTLGGSIGPIMLARIFDVTHSYTLGLVILIAMVAIAALLTLTLPPLRAKTADASPAEPRLGSVDMVAT
jgi:MFS family permease